MQKVVPLRRPESAELADFDVKTAGIRERLARGEIAGIISLVVYSDGTKEIIYRGRLFSDPELLAHAAALTGATVHKP